MLQLVDLYDKLLPIVSQYTWSLLGYPGNTLRNNSYFKRYFGHYFVHDIIRAHIWTPTLTNFKYLKCLLITELIKIKYYVREQI